MSAARRVPLIERPALKWPRRLLLGSIFAAIVGTVVLSPAARPWLIGAVVAFAVLFLWTLWDETRGRGAALQRLRERWLQHPDVIDSGGDLHFSEDRQPLIARLALGKHGPTIAVLTPLNVSTTAFRIRPRDLPAPSFDGRYPSVGGPSLTHLPGLQTLLHDALIVEGNAPARLERWLDQDLIHALLSAARDHPQSFGGLTFDGRFVAVHWIGPIVVDPEAVRALSAPLWRAFVPRLPPIRRELLN